jgi:hypothetical protein
LLGGLALLLASLVGCGPSVHVVPMTPAEKNLTHVLMAYSDACGRLGRGPKNVEELKPFLKELNISEDVLVSPNDGEPFVIVWGAGIQGGPTEYKGMFQILGYESKGTARGRVVADVRCVPMTVPQEDFAKLHFVRGHKPQGTGTN